MIWIVCLAKVVPTPSLPNRSKFATATSPIAMLASVISSQTTFGNNSPDLDPIVAIVDPVVASAIATALLRPTITAPDRSLDFDGSNDVVKVAGFGSIAPTTEITIEFWEKVDTLKTQSTLILSPDSGFNRIKGAVCSLV